ncbi:flagellar hook-associated protein FlgL [Neobacillus niacini]|uniref:flagellar hook-associated protein FlgL n=1 Tax=Neobacillus niacini TaxID=86668 RepID=UPI0020417042|nr:flagellar hook-associated protein FlgL [Neobacillus niacini]MCM3693263.1 flagellar hook-associated protein FlgL [Neobacillus niacini]
MRVTSQMVTRQFNQNIQRNNQEIYSLQQQISSGKKYEKISDNPLEAMKGMSHRTSLAQIEQYQKNAQDGMDRLTAVDDALGNVTNVMQRIRELTVQASNDTNHESDKQTISIEIRALSDQLETIANTTFNGRYLFSGMDQETAPMKNGVLQNVGQSAMNLDIGKGVTVNVNVSAGSVFGYQTDGRNLFETIGNLAQTLENGQNPGDLLNVLDQQMNNVSTQHTIIGTNHNLLELASNKLDQANFLNAKILTETEGTDIAKAYMELSSHETALQASLASGARIMQQTLVDFLR